MSQFNGSFQAIYSSFDLYFDKVCSCVVCQHENVNTFLDQK